MALGTVLVIEDDEDVRKWLRTILESADYNVIEAKDGAQGIGAVRFGKLEDLKTIICDIRIPKVSGMETIAYFRAQFPSFPVIAITGFPDHEERSMLLKQGVRGYLTKPIPHEELIAAVKKVAAS
jgi:two-component system chemotaxis response regulator CheY